MADVWDEREELFAIDDSDEENDQRALVSTTGTSRAGAEPPRIIISHS